MERESLISPALLYLASKRRIQSGPEAGEAGEHVTNMDFIHYVICDTLESSPNGNYTRLSSSCTRM